MATKVKNTSGETIECQSAVIDITEHRQAEKELEEWMDDQERFSRLTIGREEKMIQLKEEINTLQEQMGKEKRYKIVA